MMAFYHAHMTSPVGLWGAEFCQCHGEIDCTYDVRSGGFASVAPALTFASCPVSS